MKQSVHSVISQKIIIACQVCIVVGGCVFSSEFSMVIALQQKRFMNLVESLEFPPEFITL